MALNHFDLPKGMQELNMGMLLILIIKNPTTGYKF